MGVCVTGAGGYVASWLVKLLLSKGHKVHGTVRDPDDEKNSHLMRLEKAQENLRLFKANLLDYNSLCSATAGCRGVFHIASPVPSSILENPETEVLETAVRGTLNVLKACSETGVERVVIVSSTAAVVNNPNWPPNRPMDEECWSDIDYCRKSMVTAQNVQPNNDQLGSEWIYSNQMQWYKWYCISKTASEREALKYSEKSGLDVVMVCPSRILGPLLQPTMNSSSQLFIELFKGGVETIDDRIWVIVDVRDVAEALLLVYDKKEASGRYICASHPIRVQSMVEKLKSKYPYYSYPKNYIEVDQVVKLSSEKLKRFGWECREREEMGEKGRMCVTGAGGFLASWLVKLLLSKGYTVHGTVRDPGDEKNSHLKRLEKAQENLILFKANLLDSNSLCAAIVGCSGVFHVASPVPSSLLDNPETELLEAAVKGTLNVLKVCSETGVERVVVVSSTTAVVNNPNWPPNRPMDEDCWSDIDYCRETTLTFQKVHPTNDQLGPESIFTNQVQWYNWYCIAKTTSEREALKYAENAGLDVVTVCASRVLGPLLQRTVNASSQLFSELFKGGVETIDNRVWVIVDVRDVAEALLLVFEKKEASGRYICASHLVRVESVIEMLKIKYPYYNYPKNYIEVDQEVKLSSEKLKRLGWECRSLEDTIVDSVECYQEAGILIKD